MDNWFKNDLKDELYELFISSVKRGYFNKEYLEKLWVQHQNNIFDHRARIWNLISFEIWNRIYIDGIKPEDVLK